MEVYFRGHCLRMPPSSGRVAAPPHLGLSFTRGFTESVTDFRFSPTAGELRQAPVPPAQHLSL